MENPNKFLQNRVQPNNMMVFFTLRETHIELIGTNHQKQSWMKSIYDDQTRKKYFMDEK
jgi:hypothetical protein